jgi:small conductance mechanosensitive channel
MNFDIQKLWEDNQSTIISTGLNILYAILILIVGMWVIKRFVNTFSKILTSRGVDVTLIPTLTGITKGMLVVVLLIAVTKTVGIDTTGLVAILGAAGLAIGLALQGSLANFAGGILILVLKPFKNGDVITVNGETAAVQSISVVTTTLKTPDNRVIYMGNGAVAGATIINYSQEENRRLDQVYGIGYGDDIAKAKSVLKQIIDAESRIMKEPDYAILVSELGDNAVSITIRCWCKGSDFWPLHFDMLEKVKITFDKEGISFPFPQKDVHVYKEN